MAPPRSKMKVLVLASTFPRWKDDTNPPFVYDLSRRLAEKMDIIVLAPHYPGAKDTEVMDSMRVHRFHYFFERFEKLAGNGGILPTLKANRLYYLTVPFFLLFEIIATLKLVKKYKPDIIHAHWIIPQGIASYVNWLVNKTPYVITSHGSDLHSLGLIGLKRIILNNSRKITVVSNYLKEEVGKIDSSLLAKTEVIPMGVDTELFNPDKYDESIKKKYGITGKLLLFVGRLAPEKGVTYLIDAMPAVLKKFPKTKLMIIGGGTLEKELEDQASRLKIKPNVIFMGVIKHDDLPPYYATADIFVSPSLKEGLPTTYLESLSSGNYVIVGDIPISREIVTSDLIGLLVKTTKEEIYSKVISSIVINHRKYRLSVRRYDYRCIVKEFMGIYRP